MSIFDLKTNVSELSSSNDGTSRMEYDQMPPTRDIVGANFANGAIHFRWQTSGQKWWIPSRSYLRMRVKLNKVVVENESPLTVSAGIAPNMGTMANLFQSGEMRINDKTISRIADFMPQVDSLETRLTKSKSWLDSIGASTNWWQASQNVRANEISSDGNVTKSPSVPPATATTVQADFVNAGVDTPYLANTTVTYLAATGLITFASVTSVPDTSLNWAVGDQIILTSVAAAGIIDVPATVTAIPLGPNAVTLIVEPLWPADTGTINAAFSRVRTTPEDNCSRQLTQFETVWTPPLSLFKIGHALPSGRYELILNPQTTTAFAKRAIESKLGEDSKVAGKVTASDFNFEVVDFFMYIATVEGPRADDITYLLDLEQTRCQTDKVDNPNFGQKNFDVSPSTFALSVAFQDLRAGEHTSISASKFKSYDVATNPTIQQELKLNRLFINFAGQNLPAPDADPSFIPATGVDFTTQRYAETQIYSGAYFDTGGAESIQEWHDRGAYYYFSWPRDGTDRSTRVNVHSGFNTSTQGDVTNMRILLFDHSKQVARIRVQNGRVTDVQLEDS